VRQGDSSIWDEIGSVGELRARLGVGGEREEVVFDVEGDGRCFWGEVGDGDRRVGVSVDEMRALREGEAAEGGGIQADLNGPRGGVHGGLGETSSTRK
jgi:hypothetical protein